MRNKLKRLNGQRIRFTAEVARIGCKSSFRGNPTATILLQNVKQEGDDEILTDHVWFAKGITWDAATPGVSVSFDARVTDYEKGYKGHKDDVYAAASCLGTLEVDYRLTWPTKIKVEGKAYDFKLEEN
jgi:hypothetical protein